MARVDELRRRHRTGIGGGLSTFALILLAFSAAAPNWQKDPATGRSCGLVQCCIPTGACEVIFFLVAAGAGDATSGIFAPPVQYLVGLIACCIVCAAICVAGFFCKRNGAAVAASLVGTLAGAGVAYLALTTQFVAGYVMSLATWVALGGAGTQCVALLAFWAGRGKDCCSFKCRREMLATPGPAAVSSSTAAATPVVTSNPAFDEGVTASAAVPVRDTEGDGQGWDGRPPDSATTRARTNPLAMVSLAEAKPPAAGEGCATSGGKGKNHAAKDLGASAATNNESKAGLGWCEGWRRSPHMKCAVLSLGLWSVALMWLWCKSSGFDVICQQSAYRRGFSTTPTYDDDDYSSRSRDDDAATRSGATDPCASGICRMAGSGSLYWIGGAVMLVYLIESCSSHTSKYLRNTHETESVFEYVDRVKSYAPRLWWHVQCYHYEVRVNTHSASGSYAFDSWHDGSGYITGLHNYLMTKITYKKTWAPADAFTAADYAAKRDAFKTYNDRDRHMDFTSGLSIRDFTTKQLAMVERGAKPATLNSWWFLLATLTLLSWPYRLWFASITGKKGFTFHKVVRARPF